MLELHCGDLGMVCGHTVKAGSKEELVQKVAEHAAGRHGVEQLNETLVDYALTRVSGSEDGPREARTDA